MNQFEDTRTIEIVKKAVASLSEKIAKDITIIDISKISIVSDYLIIATGKNPNHIHALADDVSGKLHTIGVNKASIEGYQHANWILMDYEDVIIHIFDEESRSFYDLERLYRDGRIINENDL